MKVFRTIMIIIGSLLAVAGALYVIVAYGDRIIAWCRKQLDRINGLFRGTFSCDGACDADFAEE